MILTQLPTPPTGGRAGAAPTARGPDARARRDRATMLALDLPREHPVRRLARR